MMKKKSMKKAREKKKQPARLLFPRKGVTASTVFFLVLCTIGVTFAWFTSSDKRTNAFKGTQLVAEIDEVFTPPTKWKPGETTIKEIRVKNSGQVSAFVRVSLYEFLASFEVETSDQTGNLKTVPSPINPTLDEQETKTWEAAAKAHGTYTKESKHYVTKDVLMSDPETQTGMYEYKGTEREKTALKYITLNFSDALKETVPTTTSKSWVYEKGYFYYLSPLQPGEESKPLLTSESLSSTIPNQYKGSLYKLKVYMDAHDQTKPLLDEWQLENGSKVYHNLEQQLK